MVTHILLAVLSQPRLVQVQLPDTAKVDSLCGVPLAHGVAVATRSEKAVHALVYDGETTWREVGHSASARRLLGIYRWPKEPWRSELEVAEWSKDVATWWSGPDSPSTSSGTDMSRFGSAENRRLAVLGNKFLALYEGQDVRVKPIEFPENMHWGGLAIDFMMSSVVLTWKDKQPSRGRYRLRFETVDLHSLRSSFSNLDVDDHELDGAPAFKMSGKLVFISKLLEGSLLVRVQTGGGWKKHSLPYSGDTPTEACADNTGRCYIKDLSGNLYQLTGLN